ncbi:hypothetical protein ACIBQ1_20430 [Nonomuraea sp. NPDC050153]|uniref:hypothetical protein n=1 Tax=Nonomuraea sp. NPDC050153 TaxID=3364359 RepID=UPI003792944F
MPSKTYDLLTTMFRQARDSRGPTDLAEERRRSRLYDDAYRPVPGLAARAAKAGVHAGPEVWPHMHHTWQVAAGFLPEATEAVDRTAAFLQRVAEGGVVDRAALSGGPVSL